MTIWASIRMTLLWAKAHVPRQTRWNHENDAATEVLRQIEARGYALGVTAFPSTSSYNAVRLCAGEISQAARCEGDGDEETSLAACATAETVGQRPERVAGGFAPAASVMTRRMRLRRRPRDGPASTPAMRRGYSCTEVTRTEFSSPEAP